MWDAHSRHGQQTVYISPSAIHLSRKPRSVSANKLLKLAQLLGHPVCSLSQSLTLNISWMEVERRGRWGMTFILCRLRQDQNSSWCNSRGQQCSRSRSSLADASLQIFSWSLGLLLRMERIYVALSTSLVKLVEYIPRLNFEMRRTNCLRLIFPLFFLSSSPLSILSNPFILAC